MADGSRPNVLFICTDQQRPDWIGMHPDVPVRTPNLERLAARGTWFTDAICPSPVCNPSRACMASGMEYDRCGVHGNNMDYPLDQPTLYGRLRDEAGYHVMGCGKFDLTSGFPLDSTGDHDVERWGFSTARFNPAKNNTVLRVLADPNREPLDPYTVYLADHGLLATHLDDYRHRSRFDDDTAASEDPSWTVTDPTPLPQHAYYDDWITENARELLVAAPTDEPWFLEVDFQNPHHPWDITEEMHRWYREPPVEFPAPVDCDLPIDADRHQAVRRNYAAMVEHLDQCVGQLLDAVDERGETDETIVVFTSDHGEQLGDQGLWQKLAPFHASVGVPLVVAGPGVADRDPVSDPVATLDLHATFLDYAGVSAGKIDSRSMRTCFAGDPPPRDVVYSGLGAWRMVYDGRYKLIEGYEPAHRTGGTYPPMAVGPAIARRRQAERESILHEVHQSESKNVAPAHPAVVDRLHEDLVRIRDSMLLGSR